jgi:hypothetical protein
MTTITDKLITRYVVRAADGDYGVVALDLGERSVTVMAESSFGSYCYHWNATGCNPIEALRKMSFQYAMQKFRGGAYKVFDRAAQEKTLRAHTLEKRRARQLDAEDARWSYDEIEHVCDAYSVDQFWANLCHSELSKHLFNNDVGEVRAETCPDPLCVGFWEAIWVPLMAHLGAGATQAPAAAEAAMRKPTMDEQFIADMTRCRGMDWVRIGMQIEVAGDLGTIMGMNSSGNLDVVFVNQLKKGKHAHNCHPTWETRYFASTGAVIANYRSDGVGAIMEIPID